MNSDKCKKRVVFLTAPMYFLCQLYSKRNAKPLNLSNNRYIVYLLPMSIFLWLSQKISTG